MMFHEMENVVPTYGLTKSGFIRLELIIAPKGPLPIGRSTWWRKVNSGHFPKPVKLGPNTTAWKVEDIRALIDSLAAQEDAAPSKVAPINAKIPHGLAVAQSPAASENRADSSVEQCPSSDPRDERRPN